MPINVWPSSVENSQRLREFQASAYFPERYEERKHQVSKFWLDAVKGMFAFPGRDFVAIHSLSNYVAPEERRLREWSRQQRRVFSLVASVIGRLGTAVPKSLWTLPDRMARTWLRGSAWLNRARDKERALRAFRAVTNDKCTFTVDNLRQVRVFAEQFDEVPALILYFASVINVLRPYFEKYKLRTVLEIGPAEGVLAIALHQLLGGRFVLIDLPEVLLITFTMISYYSPEAKIILPHEVEQSKLQSDADFTLLVPEQADDIPDSSIDLALNMSSFQEMTYPLIHRYFQIIDRCVRSEGLFYCLNETRFERHPDGQHIEFANFPWSPLFRDLFCEEFPYWTAFRGYQRQHRLQMKGTIEKTGCS